MDQKQTIEVCRNCQGTGKRYWVKGVDRLVHWLEPEDLQTRCQTCNGTGILLTKP